MAPLKIYLLYKDLSMHIDEHYQEVPSKEFVFGDLLDDSTPIGQSSTSRFLCSHNILLIKVDF